MALSDTVAVLSASGEEEKTFINKLETGLIKGSGGFILEYSHMQQHKQPETLLHLNLRKYKERKLPLIVLISTTFLECVWTTIYKANIVKDITKYVNRNCIHIWLSNLDESEMKKYSTVMCRTNGPFRRVKEKELGTNAVEIVENIRKLICDVHEGRANDNYSVHEEEEQRKLKREMDQQQSKSRNMPSMSSDESYPSLKVSSMSLEETQKTSSASATTPKTNNNPPKQHNKAKKKKQESGYKMSANFMSDIVRDNIPDTSGPSPPVSLEGTSSSSSSSSKRRKKKKKTINSLLADVTHNNLYQISLLLDVGFGANWKQMASSYGIDSITIQNIELALKRQESPTMNLLSLLRTRKPELTIGDFLEKCRNIARNDVVKFIEQDVLKS